MRYLSCILPAIILGLFSCAPRGVGPSTRTIVVSPYSGLSDRELNAHYLALLLDLQKLNTEMHSANRARDFVGVHSKARNGLEKARTARRVVLNIDDARMREKRLRAIERIIADLDKLAEISGERE